MKECEGAYLYSRPIGMPAIPNTDFLFGVAPSPVSAAARTSAELRVVYSRGSEGRGF